MIYQSVLISIFVLAEPSREEQGVTRYGYSKIWKFGTFLAIARNGQPNLIWSIYIYQIAENLVLDTNSTKYDLLSLIFFNQFVTEN